MATINELKWASLTAAVNEIKSPNQFIHRKLFGRHEPKSTENIEISVLLKGREVAPFVRKNGEAVEVSGYSTQFQTVSPTNIRIKRPFTPSELLYGRQPGTVIFSPGAQYQMTAIQAHIARDLQVMADMVTNAEEWLSAQALTGTIAYSVADREVFTITFPKPAANNVTLSIFWDDADQTKPRPAKDFLTALRLVNDAVSLGVTDAIFGQEAAAAFLSLAESGNIKLFTYFNNQVQVGGLDLTQKFGDDGVIFMGNFRGINCWEYSRTATINGVDTPMIRSKYVEFVAATPAAEFVEYFGAIPDFKAFQGMNFQGERFSKSWEEEDPSGMVALLHSRPLPCLRRPGSIVSMKVVSG